jgi:hypothetical protein
MIILPVKSSLIQRLEVFRQALSHWPGYEKGRVTRYDLSRRFTHADLLRAAACDEELQALVALLGLC